MCRGEDSIYGSSLGEIIWRLITQYLEAGLLHLQPSCWETYQMIYISAPTTGRKTTSDAQAYFCLLEKLRLYMLSRAARSRPMIIAISTKSNNGSQPPKAPRAIAKTSMRK